MMVYNLKKYFSVGKTFFRKNQRVARPSTTSPLPSARGKSRGVEFSLLPKTMQNGMRIAFAVDPTGYKLESFGRCRKRLDVRSPSSTDNKVATPGWS